MGPLCLVEAVWISLVPSEAKGTAPTNYNELLDMRNQLVQIIEQCDSCMQVMMDDSQAKRRGAKKSVGRWGEDRLFY